MKIIQKINQKKKASKILTFPNQKEREKFAFEKLFEYQSPWFHQGKDAIKAMYLFYFDLFPAASLDDFKSLHLGYMESIADRLHEKYKGTIPTEELKILIEKGEFA